MEVVKTSAEGSLAANVLREKALEQIFPPGQGQDPNKEKAEERKVNLVKAVEAANEALKIYDTKVQLKIHEPSGVLIVQILDAHTEEVLRELPQEKILNLIHKFEELLGLLIDEKR